MLKDSLIDFLRVLRTGGVFFKLRRFGTRKINLWAESKGSSSKAPS
jgi:hypothetical protein